MHTIVIGRGLLGNAIVDVAGTSGATVHVVPGLMMAECLNFNDFRFPSVMDEILRDGDACNVIFAAGALDPSLSKPELYQANVALPLAIYSRLEEYKLGYGQFMTFGSIHETCPEMATANNYIWSKRELLIGRESAKGTFPWHHIQLHTLYGGTVRSHMFLGQVESSLRARQPFNMSNGNQLREYHHVDDVAYSALEYLSRRLSSHSTIEFNSGEPISLRELATEIFCHFDGESLLQIGAIPTPRSEVFQTNQTRSEFLTKYRPIPLSIIQWLESRLELR